MPVPCRPIDNFEAMVPGVSRTNGKGALISRTPFSKVPKLSRDSSQKLTEQVTVKPGQMREIPSTSGIKWVGLQIHKASWPDL